MTDEIPDVNEEEYLANDLRVTLLESGGFYTVKLYDADDYDKFYLGEDEIVSLRNYLSRVIEQRSLA